ncbi:MAG: PQQ-like beta-propeller repeat protein [Elusimicrobia bacterium]|nr:PQQ-like beta-propeller repeat protein [Candidatus Liberimonas magnetica]
MNKLKRIKSEIVSSFILACFFLVCITANSYAQPQADKKVPGVKVEKVWEKRFDETEKMKNIVFGTDDDDESTIQQKSSLNLSSRTISSNINGKTPYAKFIITDKAIRFFDKDGNKMKEVEVKRGNGYGTLTSLSYNKKYIGLWQSKVIKTTSTIPNNPQDRKKQIEKETTSSSFSIYDQNGQYLWGVLDPDDASIAISPNGDYAINYPSSEYTKSPIKFYNKINGYKSIDNLPAPHTSCKMGFSADGKLWAINIGSQNSFLILFDKDGNEIWRRDLGMEKGGEVVLSDNGEFIATIGYNTKTTPWDFYLYLYTRTGTFLWKKKMIIGNTGILFPHDTTKIIAADRSKVYMFDIKTGNTDWEREVGIDLFWPKISSDANFNKILVTSISPTKEKLNAVSSILLFDKDGNRILTQSFEPGHVLYSQKYPLPNIEMSKDGSSIYVTTNNGMEVYSIFDK